MKELVVIDSLCIGCGACIAIDEEHFEFSDDGLSQVISQENLNSEILAEAMDSCPTNAIKFIENEKAKDESSEFAFTTEDNLAAI